MSNRVVVQPKSGSVDTDLVFVAQKDGKASTSGTHTYASLVTKISGEGGFDAARKSLSFVRTGGKGGRQNVCLIGVGKTDDLTAEQLRQIGAMVFKKLASEKVLSAALNFEGSAVEGLGTEGLQAFTEGFLLANYKFDKYKSKPAATKDGTKKPKPKEFETLVVVAAKADNRKTWTIAVAEALAVQETVNVARDWSNEPSNIGTPEFYGKEAKRLSKAYGIKCRVMTEAECRREKMGLFLSVSQGSERRGCIVVMEYAPKGVRSPRTVALVGKGVTFDSGGISIKPSARMEEMKHDMSGAATLFGATLLAAKLKVPTRVVTILAFTENMPSGIATQPGNIVRARNGKSVEINNTDAEGRLVLADALDYAHEFKPDVIIDAATLTGAVGIALGKHCCAILGSDDLVADLRAVAERTQERMWQLPIYDEYLEDMKSEIADLRNVANDSNGGTIRGAIFLKQFVRKGMKWAHLDIASMAYGVGHFPYHPRIGASGMYVRTLAEYLKG